MISKEHPLIHDSDEVDVVALLQVVWRYKYFVALVACVCVLVAVVLAVTAGLVYRAQTVVTEVRNAGVGDAGLLGGRLAGLASIAGFNFAGGGAGYEDQAVLQSRHLAEEFVKRNDLSAKLLAGVGGPLSLWLAVSRFRENILKIQQDEDRGTTTITIDWSDPEVAARWANGYIALANEIIRKRALDDANRNIKYLNEQIAKTDVVELQRVMYSLVESETKTQMLANARKEYAFTVVDPAVAPEQRIWPKRKLMVLTGGVLGVLIGIALAFAHNMWRRYRVKE